MDNRLSYDEASLFNDINTPSKRILTGMLLRGAQNTDDEAAKEIALSLRYKIRDMSAKEYTELYKNIPLDTGF